MTRPVLCVWPVRTATPLSPRRRNSSSPFFSPIASTSAANHSTLLDSMPTRFFQRASSSCSQVLGSSARFTALVL